MQSVSSTYPEKPSPSLAPRVFAVLALIVAGIVVGALVAGGLGGSKSSTTTTPTTQVSRAQKDKYFVVRPGDSLAGIAAKEGVSETYLERLNPNLDPEGLQPENCVDLVPHGCRVLARKSGG